MRYNSTDDLLKWFKSYLENREQKGCNEKYNVPRCGVSAGVPQGSVQGPLLFIIFINDEYVNLISLTRLFTDETSFRASGTDLVHIKATIDHDLAELHVVDWSKKWLMTFNPDKTEVLMISNRLYLILTLTSVIKQFQLLTLINT